MQFNVFQCESMNNRNFSVLIFLRLSKFRICRLVDRYVAKTMIGPDNGKEKDS